MGKLLVLACLVVAFGGVLEGQKVYNIALNFLIRMHAKEVINMIKHSKAHEKKENKNPIAKKEDDMLYSVMEDESLSKRSFNINATIFRTGVYYIPVDKFITNAMFAIFGEDGILMKGGFYLDGYIHKGGTAALTLARGFGNRTHFINEIENARSHSSATMTPMSVITHLLLTDEDLNNLITWQKAQIQRGNLKQDDPCSPKLVIMYYCCTKTANPYLGPLYGTLKAGSD